MLTIYKSNEQQLNMVAEAVDGSWVHVTQPQAAELARLSEFGLPADLLNHINDPDERPRMERDDGVVLIVLRFPVARAAHADVPYATVPLSIFVNERLIITVTPEATGLLQQFVAGDVRGWSTGKRTRFVLHLFRHIATEFQTHLQAINGAVDAVEDRLQRSLQNREVLELLRYQKSLVYFTTALKADELVLEQLQRGKLLPLYENDDELLEDVRVEFQQALEVTDISQNILSQMMDAFASIISNNLNGVMKLLTSVTIIISLPTLIASVYGMNVGLPGEEHPLAFAVIAVVSALSAIGVALFFRRKNWL